MKKYMVLVAAMMMIAGMVSAQEVEGFESAEIADTLIANVDTVEVDPDLEWYVAPLNYDSVMARRNAPRRAAAANCPVDSVLTFDVEGNLVGVVIYEYDAAGNTIRTTEWIVQAGSRTGKEMKEWGFDGTGKQIMKATYSWDNTTSNWKGTSKEEHTYVGNNETVRILYKTWLNNAWVADTKYTWAYEGVRDTAYVVYVRNTSTNELVLSAKRIRAYTSSGKTILEIQYTAHNGTTWSAGTKKVWDFDGSNNQILYDYFASYLGNDTWGGNGSTHEVWEYLTSQKKLRYEKTTISGGVWTNSQKEVWEYNSNQQQTLHKKWNGSGDNWVISVEENSFYAANNLNTGIENYAYSTAGALLPTNKNTKKEEYTFNSAKKKIATVKYKWDTASSGWVKNSKVVSDVDAAGNSIETANYNWSTTSNEWVGAGQRILQKWNSSKKNVDKITQSWSNGAWVNSKRDTTAYEGGTKTIFQASFVWQNDMWIGTSRKDWHYNSAGLEDTVKTFRPIGTEWVDSLRTVSTYNGTTLVLTNDEKWITSESRWVMQTMKHWEISDVTTDGVRQTVTAIWKCGSDTIWTGISNDTIRYSVPQGKVLYEAHYPSWSTTNNDWEPSYRITTTYGAFENNVTYTRRDDWTGNKWQGHYMYLYEYDEIGQEIASEIYNEWSTETNNWIGSTKTQTTFNAVGYPIEIWNYSWVNNTWSLSSRTLLSYDGANNVVEQIEQNKFGESWVNSLRYEKEFQGGQMVKSNNYEWVNGAWRLTSQMEKIYDNDAQAKLRRDIYGVWYEGQVIVFTDKNYYYACDLSSYTIRFENYDGTLLESHSVQETKTPVYEGAKPSRPATAQYTYTFKSWDAEIVAVTGDAVYTAEYDSVVNRYRITWLDADNAEIAIDSLEYGATPSHEDLVKANTAEWTYSFVGWTPAITTVVGDATYKAQFDSIRNAYLVTFKNGEDTLQSALVAYGSMPVYGGETPTKQADVQYSYTFNGWDAELVAVSGEATYNATFSSTVNSYLVTFKNDADTLQSTLVAYGTMPVYEGETPTKQADAQYTYSFNGWDAELVAVTGETTYNATFSSTVNGYLVTFKNGADTLQSTLVAYGTMPVYGGETPTKQADVQYSYTFNGWDAELAAVTDEATYNATFSSTVNTYLVTFKNGDDILQSTQVAYGSMPEYTGNEPTKQADAQYTYSFNGWDAELVSVAGEATYNATFSSTINNYRITFKNGEDTLQSTLVAYGTMPVYGGETPTKQADAQYTYSFNGWDAELVEVTGETTYNATFSSTVNNYTITWLLDDGTKIDEQSVAYGTTPSHTDAHKDNTAQYTITFVGWDKEFAAVTGDETYTAVFDSVVNRYNVIFYFEDGVTVLDSKEFEYGEMPSTSLIPSLPATAKYTYTFAGWSPELQPVTGNAAYTPVFDSIVNIYTVTFVNYNNMVLQSSQVPYDDVPEYTGETPTKPSSYKYHYVFTGWTPDIVTVTGDARYKAVYEQVLNSYTILFYDEDGLTILDSVEVDHGEMPETSVVPTKEDDEEYTYTFAGWSPKIVSATKNTSYTATYTATRKTEGLWDVESAEKAQKVMIDGVIYIRRGGKIYTLDGTEVE